MKQVMIKISKCGDCPNVIMVRKREEYSKIVDVFTCKLTGNELINYCLHVKLPYFCPLEDA